VHVPDLAKPQAIDNDGHQALNAARTSTVCRLLVKVDCSAKTNFRIKGG